MITKCTLWIESVICVAVNTLNFFSLLLFPAGFWHAFSFAVLSPSWSVWDSIFQLSIISPFHYIMQYLHLFPTVNSLVHHLHIFSDITEVKMMWVEPAVPCQICLCPLILRSVMFVDVQLELFFSVNILQFIFLALRLDEFIVWRWVVSSTLYCLLPLFATE